MGSSREAESKQQWLAVSPSDSNISYECLSPKKVLQYSKWSSDKCRDLRSSANVVESRWRAVWVAKVNQKQSTITLCSSGCSIKCCTQSSVTFTDVTGSYNSVVMGSQTVLNNHRLWIITDCDSGHSNQTLKLALWFTTRLTHLDSISPVSLQSHTDISCAFRTTERCLDMLVQCLGMTEGEWVRATSIPPFYQLMTVCMLSCTWSSHKLMWCTARC